MPETPSRAVFLSYAREDVAVARRIAEALRAGKVEVWFDENELRGGVEWDASIRVQLRSCALFMAVISANTQARREGYFRREWKAAVERTHDMADGMPFLLPVVIDATAESTALVPAQFLRVQWTRLAGGLPTPQFVEVVRQHLVQRDHGLPVLPAPFPVADGHAGERRSEKSIAVLPFANMSSDQENEFLSDGITEDLITALSKLAGLRVPARTSSFAFKGKNEDIRVIGARLSVTTVLEGSVRKAGNRLRITAQLVNVADGYHLWSERYDRELQDVFEIQDDITRAIVNALKVKLVGEAGGPFVKPPTASMEAYQLYLKGRELWYQRGPALMKALHYFQLALLEDRNYALAYSGLADTQMSLSFYGYAAPSELIPKARAAIQRALDLEPTLAEAHLSDATVKSWHDWDFGSAETAYLRAIQLKPNFALAHTFFATHLCGQGRFDESIAQAARAVDLDPLSPYSNALLGWMSSWGDRYDNAAVQLQVSLELAPNYGLAHWLLGQNFAAQSQFAEAIASFEKAAELSGGASWVQGFLAHAYAASGQPEKALALLGELLDTTRQPFVRSFHAALVHAGLGHDDLVFEWLGKAYEERDLWMRWLRSHYAFDRLHGDPRFIELVHKIGLDK